MSEFWSYLLMLCVCVYICVCVYASWGLGGICVFVFLKTRPLMHFICYFLWVFYYFVEEFYHY